MNWFDNTRLSSILRRFGIAVAIIFILFWATSPTFPIWRFGQLLMLLGFLFAVSIWQYRTLMASQNVRTIKGRAQPRPDEKEVEEPRV